MPQFQSQSQPESKSVPHAFLHVCIPQTGRASLQQSWELTHELSHQQLPPLLPHSVFSQELQPLLHIVHALVDPLPGQQSPAASHVASQ